MREDREAKSLRRYIRIKPPPGDQPEKESATRRGAIPADEQTRPAPEGPEAHTRVVIPRHERRDRADWEPSDADIELREVRFGSASHMPYLRIVPRQRPFIRVAPGQLEATRLASRPRDIVGRYLADIKQVFIGSPFATSQAIHERLSKVMALAILSSDALSSSAYATEEILIALLLAGSTALHNALPIAAVITLLLAIVTLSYRQTIKAYPSGGGAYIVAQENLGRGPGLTAAAALLVDYTLTVSVSVAAGVAAITSAVPELHDVRVPIGVAVVAFFTVGNLRGIREAGTIFAAPTYLFIISMATMIVVGLIKVAIGDAPGSLLHGAPPKETVAATQGLTLLLILRAFSSGSTAMTGVEAISNAVPVFKPPETQNARITLTAMACILAFLFLGITFLSSHYGLVPQEQETIVSMLGREILGRNVLYYIYQLATALVLFLAANTSYAGFPRLAAILAENRFMPRQFAFKGDRLAYSNGIIVLAIAASVLIVVFGGEVTKLIPLYAVGVFVSFTLSQSGMVKHWWRLREAGWRRSLVINGVGAVVTAVVALIIGGTKFARGAWISILMMLLLMLLFTLIRRHYDWFDAKVRTNGPAPAPPPPTRVPLEQVPARAHVVVPIDTINKVSLAAVSFARELGTKITAVHTTDDREQAEELRARWVERVPDVPLLVIESPYRAFVAPMLTYVELLEKTEPDVRIIVVVPSFVARHWWERLLHNQDAVRLKPHLKKRPRVRVVDFPYRVEDGQMA